MKKTVISKFANKNLAGMRRELARAHIIIALLSLVSIALLALGSVEAITFDATLSAICVVLLSIVALISVCMSVTLFRQK